MRIGFIGDVIGKPGRQMVAQHLKKLRIHEGLDFVIANGENVSHGFGTTIKSAEELFSAGVDVITGGNHTWDKREVSVLLQSNSRVLRPHNYPQGTLGTGIGIYDVAGSRLAVLNLMGHFAMPMCENPFICARDEVTRLRECGIAHIVVDFHAEATSEKRAMFWLLEGRASAIFGTHTHVGTDDLEISNGTFGVSDVGASGCMDGVIGMDRAAPIERFLTGMPVRLEVPQKCRTVLQMVVLELDGAGRCVDAYKIKAVDGAILDARLEAFRY
ncbi:MAG: TIGR00282 family metallophosphoesterase [Wolinella sp.]